MKNDTPPAISMSATTPAGSSEAEMWSSVMAKWIRTYAPAATGSRPYQRLVPKDALNGVAASPSNETEISCGGRESALRAGKAF
jgi:hypothetical protein